MPFSEFIDVPGSIVDVYGNRRITRAFKVWDVDIATVRFNPQDVVNPNGDKLPILGSGLPTDWIDLNPPGTPPDPIDAYEKRSVLEFYSIHKQGNMILAIANYTTTILDDRLMSTFQYSSLNLPYQFKIAQGFSAQSGSAPGQAGANPIFQWVDTAFSIPTVFTRWQLEVMVTKTRYIRSVHDISRQVNNLHYLAFGYGEDRNFSVGWYKFESADAIHAGPIYNRVRYSWIHDPGMSTLGDFISGTNDPTLPPPIQPPGSPGLFTSMNRPARDKLFAPVVPNGVPSTARWVRPPYTTISAVAQVPDNPNYQVRASEPIPKRFIAIPTYNRSDPLGWNTLPGIF